MTGTREQPQMRNLTFVMLAVATAACGLDPDADGPSAGLQDAAVGDTTGGADADADGGDDTTPEPDEPTDDDAVSDALELLDDGLDGDETLDAADAEGDNGADDETDCLANGCGGCASLPTLGDPCGPCALDTLVCDGADALRCSGDTACPAEPDVIVGTGITAFVAPSPGDVFMLTQGVQGGFHIWGGVSASGVDPRGVELEFTATNGAGDVVASVFWLTDLAPVGGRFQASGVTVFVDPTVIVDAVNDEPWRLCVALTDAAGAEASDCVDLTARCCTLVTGG